MIATILIVAAFFLKTTTAIPAPLNLYIPILAIYFATTHKPANYFFAISTLLLLNYISIGNNFVLIINYLLLIPIFFIFRNNFFRTLHLKAFSQGTVALFIFFSFRLIFISAGIANVMEGFLYSELLLIFLLPFVKISKW